MGQTPNKKMIYLYFDKQLIMKKILIAILISVVIGIVIYEINLYFFNYDISIAPIVAAVTTPIIIYLYKDKILTK